MPSVRLEQQYLRLWELFEGQQQLTTLQKLSEVMHCSRRHMRSLLQSMEKRGWLQWGSSPGRGKQSQLLFLSSNATIRQQCAMDLLVSDKFSQLAQWVGDKESMKNMLLSQLGQTYRQGRHLLKILYYRPMPNLLPGSPLRRSETHLVRQIFNGLTQINEENGEVEPDIAHHWQQLSDRRWRFWIRPGIHFHHGRELVMDDIISSLQRLTTSTLFSHLTEIVSPMPWVVDISLAQQDKWLAHLLGTTNAMILPIEWPTIENYAAVPSGTGSYKVVCNNSQQLKITAFDKFFGYRALLDEVTIWLLSDSEQPGRLNMELTEDSEGQASTETRLEEGCYFLLFDRRSVACQRPEVRAWLQQVLEPVALLCCSPEEYHPQWFPAWGLIPRLPMNSHKLSVSKPEDLQTLTLTYYTHHPEHLILTACIEKILQPLGISLKVQEISYQQWYDADAESDLWLGSATFAKPVDFSLIAHFFDMPIFQHCMQDNGENYLTEWRKGSLSVQEWGKYLIENNIIHPLFHNRLILEGRRSMRGVKMNALGWFDFKSAWYTPSNIEY
jgi:SgrR family transcriptional regulator